MPQAILLADHENLGAKGTVVDVSKGYLRNYLIPRKLAQPATKGAILAAQDREEREQRAHHPAPPRHERGEPGADTSAAFILRTSSAYDEVWMILSNWVR